jgi:membrane-bound lytic murein transglycosylase D
MWMFIPPTARLFGLRVDRVLDERLDPGRETAAAARYLARLHRHFGDWGLALAAYNRGERLVEAAILESGSRDTWALVSRGLLSRYPAVVMAAGLLAENPSLVAD